jgi:hypothetical protein
MTYMRKMSFGNQKRLIENSEMLRCISIIVV